MPALSLYQWHPAIHSHVGKERLVYVLAEIGPFYRRQPVIDAARSVFKDLGVRSYSIWELLGRYDVLLQAWLPNHIGADAISKSLQQKMRGNRIQYKTLPVDSFPIHWMWPRINVKDVDSHVEQADYGAINIGEIPEDRVRDYKKRHYIHEPLRTELIKVYVLVTFSGRSMNDQVERTIFDITQKIFEDKTLTHGVTMKLSGGGSYLLSGRLDPKHFEALAEGIKAKFDTSGTLEMLGCRTETHLSSLYWPLERVEQLLPPPPQAALEKPTASDIERWLQQSESDDLEFKSSAYTDIDHRVGRKAQGQAAPEQTRQVAKAIVGMLNATGGTVVIGVAELGPDRYSEDELRKVSPEGERQGDRFVLGIEHEYPARGGWDKYQRDLAAALRKAIDGGIDGWIRFYNVQFGAATLCVIRIRWPSRHFYVKDTARAGEGIFYGRTGGQTVPLSGTPMDEFREANPRKPGPDDEGGVGSRSRPPAR